MIRAQDTPRFAKPRPHPRDVSNLLVAICCLLVVGSPSPFVDACFPPSPAGGIPKGCHNHACTRGEPYDDWVQHLCQTVTKLGIDIGIISTHVWKLFSDCAGLDALATGLEVAKDAGVPVRTSHEGACDYEKNSQAWLSAVHRPKVLFNDILERNFEKDCASFDLVSQMEKELPESDVYGAGFPCTPYSYLHFGSRGVEENAARPMFQVQRTILKRRPRISILENVRGIMKPSVWPTVKKLLDELLQANMSVTVICGMSPHCFGEPLHRDRVYIVVADRTRVSKRFQKILLKILGALKREPTRGVSDILRFTPSPAVPRPSKRRATTPCTCSLGTSCTRYSVNACTCTVMR